MRLEVKQGSFPFRMREINITPRERVGVWSSPNIYSAQAHVVGRLLAPDMLRETQKCCCG